MKKIMFNDKYGLTQSVLEGRKTQTRRILHCPKNFGSKYVSGFRVCTNSEGLQFVYLVDEDECEIEGSVNAFSSYKIGEEVAVAQSYHDAKKEVGGLKGLLEGHPLPSAKGIKNKMFVKADLMPHRIKITNIRVERLQDISNEDCMKEGIIYSYDECNHKNIYGCITGNKTIKITPNAKVEVGYDTPQKAFKYLIDKVSGKGTWDSNPWVFVYDFELTK